MDSQRLEKINMLNQLSSTSMFQFRLFRIIFGIYLTWHFAGLLPHATEIFSNEGIMAAEGLNPFRDKKVWPNPFFIWGSPLVLESAIALGVVASVLLMLGKFTRVCALLLWFLFSCLFTANPLTANPSLGYVGLLLLLIVIIPKRCTHLPKMTTFTAWVLLVVGYSFSGLYKLGSPSWLDGSAMSHLMTNPLARPGFVRDLMLSLPDGFLMLLTWGTLALELFFVPLAIFRITRPYAWFLMLFMHLGIMLTVDFADLSMGMVMMHLFTFQYSWVSPKSSDKKRPHILFLDGECLFCQKSVQILYRLDVQKNLHFSHLQGEAAKVLPESWTNTVDENDVPLGNVVLIENYQKPSEKRWRAADAIFRSLYLIGGIYKVAWVFHYLPSFIKTSTYNFIAKNRYRLMGKKDSCEMPDEQFQGRFIP
ncbi:MAG: DCC1-like thiol-disulfide oxidoreductase family protein [Akkermansiaceae bacterium]